MSSFWLTLPAEIALKTEEKKPEFSLLLLNIVASGSLPLNTRLSGALCFKNFIKFNWVVSSWAPILAAEYSEEFFQDEEGTYKLAENEVMTIKKELIGLMISVPPSIQAQLGETISVIADSDFWTRWDTLVDVSLPSVCCHVRRMSLTLLGPGFQADP